MGKAEQGRGQCASLATTVTKALFESKQSLPPQPVGFSNHAHALRKSRLVVFDPLALRVNDTVLSESVFELFAGLCHVLVHAAVAEGTFALALVEETARDFSKCFFVLLD